MRAMLPSPPPRRLAVLVVAAVLLAVASNAYHYHDGDWAADAGYGYGGVAACAGAAVGPECTVAARTRRELGGFAGIGYGALEKNRVPCSQRGASYYVNNCSPGAAANPYTRGCSAITQCRG